MTQKKNIKIVFWGTPEFALPTLEALIKNVYNVIAVVTNPDKPIGRKNIITPPPIKVWAEKHKPRTFPSRKVRGKIPVFQPVSLKDPNIKKELPEADLYIITAYGKIIPKDILDLPKLGALNIHPSLLPRWRGPSPIQYTVLSGDTETGITIIKMDELMDHGPILAQRELEISKTTYKELHDKLAKLGARLLIETIPKWIAGEIKPVPQNEAEATYSKILKKDDGRIDWSWTAEKIEKMVHAFTPWPGVWTTWPQDKKKSRLRIEEAGVIKQESTEGATGYVWQTKSFSLLIKSSQGSLAVKKLTLEGKKSMRAEDFLRGYPQIIGQTLL